jgi:hypothetical protein
MAGNLTFKDGDDSRKANRKLWAVTVTVAALILMIALLSWLNLHVH